MSTSDLLTARAHRRSTADAPAKPRGSDQRDLARLVVTCPDRPGIVAAISRVLYEQGANIVHADQHSTAQGSGQFFMRVELRLPDLEGKAGALEAALRPVAGAFRMEWRLSHVAHRQRLAIFVSRAEHALLALLWVHHSFLPAFVGANPYAAAHERGVKLIGATAHYVTEDLDAGPIIEQDLQRVDHRHTADDLRRLGRYIERVVLARAVAWHVEDRVLLDGNTTIVFS